MVVVVAVSGSLGGKEVDMCMTHLVQEEMVCTERIQQVTLQVGGWVCMWVIWPLSDVIGTQERFHHINMNFCRDYLFARPHDVLLCASHIHLKEQLPQRGLV